MDSKIIIWEYINHKKCEYAGLFKGWTKKLSKNSQTWYYSWSETKKNKIDKNLGTIGASTLGNWVK